MHDREQDMVFMRLALAEARAALDAGEFPVGCIITDGERVLASGFRKTSRGTTANELDHAEIMALRNLWETRPGSQKDRLCLYSTLEPCLMCFGAILISGIRRIVYAFEDAMGGGTALSCQTLPPLYQNLTFKLVPNVCREESLQLLQDFFADTENSYLRNTLFETYTMGQNTSHLKII